MDPEKQVQVFKALGDPTRLEVLRLLPDQPICEEMYNVADLVQAIGGSQPNMSRHLHILKQAGLVKCRKKCCSVYYYRLPEAFQALRGVLEELSPPGET
jgi:ArsR family transcriptional regulator